MLSFLKSLFSRQPRKPTVEELIRDVAEGRRESVPWTELHNAVRREVAVRPKGLRLPRKGNRFRAIRDIEVHVGIWFHAPYSSSCRGVIPKGEILRLDYDPDPSETTGCTLAPERYDDLEEQLVDSAARSDGPYSGYTLSVSYVELDRDFEWLDLSE